MNNAILAIIVSYHPTNQLLKLVQSLRDQVTVYVVDNGSGENDALTELEQNRSSTLLLERLPSNEGIAAALNRGVARAESEGFTLLLTFDQDSEVSPLFIEEMYRFYLEQKEIVRGKYRLGAIAPDFIDMNAGTHARFFRVDSLTLRQAERTGGVVESSFTITSGTLYLVSLFKEIGWFKESYFIDYVDAEFGLRLQKNGYISRVNEKMVLQHRLGDRTVRRILFLRVKPLNHSPSRRYYMSRNLLRLTIENGLRFPALLQLYFMLSVHELLSILFFEKEKWAKLRGIFQGVLHGITKKMGPWRG